MPEQLPCVFVYGTLMRGFCRHFALQNQKFLGEARTLPLYRMVNCGEYPGLLEAEPGTSIHGEVWEVTPECLQKLDDVEGVEDQLYIRKRIKLEPPYNKLTVEAYFYARPSSGLPDCGDRWT